jgi:8-oxo-dGTP diphosphatase
MSGRLRSMTSVYLTRNDQFLLLFREGGRVVNHVYTGSAGGHFEKEELNDPQGCILREMKEELGLSEEDIEGLSLRYITHRLAKGEIRQNYYFFARLKEDRELSSNEGQLRWVPHVQIPELPMPVSAKHMILHYLSVGQNDEILYCGITEEGGTNFVPMAEFEG